MSIQPYTPTQEDVAWIQQQISLVRHGGMLVIGKSGAVYTVNKEECRFIMTGVRWMDTPAVMMVHHRTAAILAKIGWKCVPEIDWDAFHAMAASLDDDYDDLLLRALADAATGATGVVLRRFEHDGKEYAVGRCEVRVGTLSLSCVATVADDERCVLPAEPPGPTIEWLVKRGLPRDVATKRVGDALATPNQE